MLGIEISAHTVIDRALMRNGSSGTLAFCTEAILEKLRITIIFLFKIQIMILNGPLRKITSAVNQKKKKIINRTFFLYLITINCT